MYELTLKRRVSIFLGVLFLVIPLSFGGVYLTLDAINYYLSFPDAIVFSSFIIYGALLNNSDLDKSASRH